MLQTSQLRILTPQKKVLLDDISLCFSKGKLYGLIGHNGSGKSTLIKALAGEIPPTEGQVLIDNEAVHTLPPKTLAKKIAYLPQKLPDSNSFTVHDLVMLGRFPHQGWLDKPSLKDLAIVDTALSKTGVTPFADQPISQLSGGEKARAWLAMCLAQETDYLLLDEPLAPLDIVYQVEILTLLKSLAQEGLGVILILHDINLASQFCDELVALKQSTLCHHGTTESLMTPEKLQDIFGIHLTLINHPTASHKVAVL